MDAKEFVKLFRKEKDNAVKLYFSGEEDSAVSAAIADMKLTPEQNNRLKTMVDDILTDTYYSLLLGLDGCGSIGDDQITYKIYDEDDNLISDCGEIESEAYEQFHGEE